MGPNRALLSFSASADEGVRNDHIKLCYLWYDEVLLENLGRRTQSEWIERLVNGEAIDKRGRQELSDVIAPVASKVSMELREKLSKLDTRGYPRWGENYENFTYPEPRSAEEYAHNSLLRKIERDWGPLEGMGVEHAEGRARIAVDAVSLWKDVNSELPCMLQATEDEKLAMSAAMSFGTPRDYDPRPFQVFKLAVPSFATVPWSEVLELKRKGRFDRLRTELTRVVESSTGNLQESLNKLREAEVRAVEEIVDRYRPHPKAVVAEALWCNIPNIPFLNPIGTYFSARSVAKEKAKAARYEWLYLLRDIRAIVE